VIGEQPPVPDVPPAAAKVRVQITLRRLIGVFARAEHPLALFFDDLQWLDGATLDLLENILAQPEPQQLLLIGAYRDNEIDAAHPLMRRLSAIRASGAVVPEIVLGPLAHQDLTHWFADALRCPHERALPLAQLVHEKTGGNPFFANQFLQELVEDDLISVEPSDGRWRWDLGPIRAKGYTDNVVDLMVGKLSRLPLTAQQALKALAYLGNRADASTLAMVHGASEKQLHADLWEALRLELIIHADDSYRFVHDRVQEAAYSLVPEEQRAARHLRVGRLLTTRTAADSREHKLFDIVGHFNRASTLVTSRDEREHVAALNLTAGKRAKKAAAFASALAYLTSGSALLDKDDTQRHDLAFELELHRAECELLIGEMASAEERLKTLSSHALSTVERAAVVCLQADVYYALQRRDRGLETAADCLRRAGLDFPLRPTAAEAQAAYTRLLSTLDGVGIDEVAALPLMSDPTSRAVFDVLVKMSSTAASVGDNIQLLIASNAVALTLQHGIHDGSSFAFVWLGYLAGWRYGNFKACFRFGQLGYELIERKGLRRFEGYVCLMFSTLMMPWAKHVLTCRPVIDRTFEVCHNTGDRMWAVASRNILLSNLLMAGDPLADVDHEAEGSLAFCKTAAFADYTDTVAAQAALVRSLRGLTPQFGSLDDERFDERRMENHFATQPHAEPFECWYWVRKLQARCLAGQYAAALEASHHAQGLLAKSPGMLERAEHELYSALTRAALCDSPSSDEGRQHFEAVGAHHRQLEIWAGYCPENFENRALLVAAEIARIEGRDLDATRLYEEAVRSARDNGFVNNEALALEIAARFYAGRGLERIARAYVRDARASYRQWGAEGKVRQLDQQYPQLRQEKSVTRSTSMIAAPVEHLDLATVIKVSQAVSGEMVLEKLIDRLMRAAIEHAGAERGLLILRRGDDLRIEAEAMTGHDAITVRLLRKPPTASELATSVLAYVLRTKESVILDDASAINQFSADAYIGEKHLRSLLCLPLENQGILAGVLYLENNVASHVFTPSRIDVLKLLVSQAAISLENAWLYDDLQKENRERQRAEKELQQLVDFVPQLVVVLGPDGKWIHANRVAREYIGLTLEDYRSVDVVGTVIHPDDVENMRAVRDRGFSANDPFEVEARLRGKDGVYRWFLFRYNPLVEEGSVRRWYGTATEIESRKQEEERIRKENVRLEERTRIAQELHDTLLQTFLSASMQLGVAVDGVPTDSLAKPRLDRILQLMNQGIEEGRNTIQGLRSSDSQRLDLVLALSRVQQELEAQPDVDFRVNVIGRQQPLRPPIQHEIYRIGREALVNAFRHSHAKHVELELEYADSDLRLWVRDDGRGIDPEVLDSGREGHWGLAGMHERAEKIGARLKIRSRATGGTEVELSVPNHIAFEHEPSQRPLGGLGAQV
jgi:PAS domain S-box-containing protein